MDESGVPIWNQDEQSFYAWATSNPDILPHLVSKMPLYFVIKRPAGEQIDSSEKPPADPVVWIDDEEPVGNLPSDECYVWHPLASCVLHLCGINDMVSTLHCRLSSLGSTSSRVPYIQTRLSLIRDFEQTEQPGLRAVACELAPMLVSEIEREEMIDAQRAAGIRAHARTCP